MTQKQQRLDIEEIVKYLREQIGGLSYNNAILKAQAVTLEKEKAEVEERLKHTEDLNKALEEKVELLEKPKQAKLQAEEEA